MNTQRPTPRTDSIIEYLRVQFPATEGHIPLREKIGDLERENEAMRAAIHEAATALEWLSTAAAGGMQPANGKINAIRNAKTVLATLKPFLPETSCRPGE